MSDISFGVKCKVNTNVDTDKFVGIKCDSESITVSFPLGYRLGEDEKQLRKDILTLLNVLSKNTEHKETEVDTSIGTDSVTLPIHAYLYLISDYYSRGYFKEKETITKVSKRGKINWSKTIKTQRAYLQDDEVYYLDFVTRRENINDNELITLIHEYCVYESFSKVGWIFTDFFPQKPHIKYNKKLFNSVVTKKLKESFNDKNRQLFWNMLAVINALGDKGSTRDYKYGTYDFEYVWETMVDSVYGVTNKSQYYPKTRWIIKGKQYEKKPLRPDTIMIAKDKFFVLDAKYYKYGQTGLIADLPDSESINKQITYGEYIAESGLFKDSNGNNPTVYNAFLMPYDAYGNTFHTGKEIYHMGNAISDWKITDGSKEYEEIVGVLIDVKALMQNFSHSDSRIIKLGELIETSIQLEKNKGSSNSLI